MLTVKEKFDEVIKDWFNRDGETFVPKRLGSGFSWVEEGTDGYSNYILDTTSIPDNKILIYEAYKSLKHVLNGFPTSYIPRIRLLKSESRTDGTNICVATEVFDDPKLSKGYKVDVFFGLGIHEMAHVLYTDFKMLREKLEEANDEHHQLLHTISNILEDERIENNICEEYPGYALFLERTKNYYFDYKELKGETVKKDKFGSKTKKGDSDGVPDSVKAVNQMLEVFSKCIRYPKYLTEELVTTHVDFLYEVKQILTPYPITYSEVWEATLKIYALFLKSIEDMDDEGKEYLKKFAKKPSTESMLMEALEEMLSKLKELNVIRVIGGPSNTREKEIDIPKSVKINVIDTLILDGVMDVDPRDPKVFFVKQQDNHSKYTEALKDVALFAGTLGKFLKLTSKDSKLVVKSTRSGYLDTGKLAEAKQGVQTIYERYGEITTQRISVALLIDESGSMGGSNVEAARRVAILFNEALKKVNDIDFFIYGHTADEIENMSTDITVYREPGYNKRYSLGNVKARCQNRDGMAIIKVAERIRSFTKNRTMLFVISDGAPCAGGYGDGIRHTKEMADKAEKMGFDVIHIAIDTSVPSERMFKHYVKFTDLKSLPVDIGNLVKRTITKARKSSVTMH